jgi:hypothetical protein
MLKCCLKEGSDSALCLSRSRVLRYLQPRMDSCLRLKSADQFLPGSEPHIREAHVRTIAGIGGRHHSQSLCICLTSPCSCLLVSNLRPSMRLATDPALPRNRLLRVDLLTLNLRATAAILRSLETLKNAIASSIGAMVVELSREEVGLLETWVIEQTNVEQRNQFSNEIWQALHKTMRLQYSILMKVFGLA